jgi:cell filamentation protein
MRRKDRYDTADIEENQFEPGSRRRVLKNLLHVTSKREMDKIEGREQVRVLEELAGLYDRDHRFTADDICRIHRRWLEPIYSWAGHYRQVNVKKDAFSFAAAAKIPKLMAEFESGPLKRHTPSGRCREAISLWPWQKYTLNSS